MFTKYVVFFGMVAAAAAVAVPVYPVGKVAYAEPEAPANYNFQYSVHDNQSGDVKQQQEARAGDAVHGSYSLVQPDGVHRIVEYTADKEHGFNAIVRYEGQPIQAPAPAKIAYAAPVAKLAYSAPVAYAAPVAKIAYAAPVAKVAYSAPVAYAAPAIKAYTAPVTYAAPITKVAYAAPVAKFAYAAPVAKVNYASAPIAKVAYESSLGHVTFSSPAVSYSH